MARGFAGGLLWGGVIVVAGLVTLSQLAPLPDDGGLAEGEALPATETLPAAVPETAPEAAPETAPESAPETTPQAIPGPGAEPSATKAQTQGDTGPQTEAPASKEPASADTAPPDLVPAEPSPVPTEPPVQSAVPKSQSAEPAPSAQAEVAQSAEPLPKAELPPLPEAPAVEAQPPSLSALDQALTQPDPLKPPATAPLGVTEAPEAATTPRDGLMQPGAQLAEPTRLPQISEEPDPGLTSEPLPQLAPKPEAASEPALPEPAPPEPVLPEPVLPSADPAQTPPDPAANQAPNQAPNPAMAPLPATDPPQADGLPGKPVTALPPAPGIAAKPALSKPEGDRTVVVNELPQIGKSAADADADAASPDLGLQGPLVTEARDFDNPGAKPLFVILLRDVGAEGLPRAQLAQLPFPVSVVIDPLAPDAKEAAQAWRAAGQEVVMLGNGLPQGAQAEDVAQSFQAMGAILPQAVAVLDPFEAGFQDDRKLAGLVVSEVANGGRGLLTWDRGLNAADQIARRDGVPQALIYRDLDSAGESQVVMRRYLDRAAFKAGQEGSVLVIGDTRAETVEVILGWALEGKGASVALAPVSAALLADR